MTIYNLYKDASSHFLQFFLKLLNILISEMQFKISQILLEGPQFGPIQQWFSIDLHVKSKHPPDLRSAEIA